MSLFCRKLVEITPKKRPFLWSFGYWASIFNLKNKDRFEHEIVLNAVNLLEWIFKFCNGLALLQHSTEDACWMWGSHHTARNQEYYEYQEAGHGCRWD